MKILALDLSMNSSGLTKFTLDNYLNVIEKDYLGFTSVKKLQSDKIFHYKKDGFKDELEKDLWFRNHILNFANDCEYAALEGYSYGSFGTNYEIGQFIGLIKYALYEMGIKLRIYDINSIKMFATGKGNSDKLDMYEAYLKLEKTKQIIPVDLESAGLPIPNEKTRKKGVSPLSDVVDSFHICTLLLTELRLRRGLVQLKELNEETIKVFNRVTKSNPVNILAQDFIWKGN